MAKTLNTSLASRLGLNTPLTELPTLPVKKRPLWHKVIASILLASSLLVQTGQVLAQYQYGQGAYSPSGEYNNAPKTGYAPNGQLYLGGQPYKEPQAHIDARNVANAILYNVVVKGLSEPTATNPGFVHDSLSVIDSGAAAANASASAGGGRSATVVYFGKTNNIYGVNGSLTAAPTPTATTPNALTNYTTYKDILTNAPGSGYQTIVAPPNAPGTAAVPYVNGPYLAKTAAGSDSGLAAALFYNAPNSTAFDLAQSTQTPTGSSLIGGGVAVNLNQNATQVNHLANLSGGLTFANTAWLNGVDPNQANQLSFGSDFGYFGRQGQYVALSSAGVGNLMSGGAEGGNDTGMLDRQALIKQLQQQAQKLDKREGYQIAANSLNLNGFSPTDLFREGYDLYKYNPSLQANGAAQNDLLRRLQSGQLSAGSADYMEAVRIAQERYRIAYSVRLEYKTPLKFSVEDAQRKANQLNLEGINPNELFGQGFDLFVYNPAIQPNGAAENALLARLQSGQLTPGSSEYNQAAAIAQERLRIAYSQSLVPPEPKSIPKWKLIVGVVVGAVLTFVTAGAAAPFIGAALGLGTTSLVVTSIAGIVGSYVGAVVSTGITTGSMSQALRAGEKALVSGSVKAIVANALGAGFIGDIIGGALGNTVAYGGSFGDNLKGAVIGAAVNGIADTIGKDVAGFIANNTDSLGAVGTELAHGALGCVTGMIRSQSGEGCVAGAVGAVVGHVSAPMFEAAGLTVYGRSADETTSFFSSTLGGAVSAAVGSTDKVQSNFGVGQTSGANAVDNNYLTFKPKDTENSQLNQFANELDACKKTAGCNQDDVYAKWTKIRNDQQAGQIATSDGVFNALSPEAMAAGGTELGNSIVSSYVNPADVCRSGDTKCYNFVNANNTQAAAVTRNVIVGAGAMDLGGTVRPSTPVSKPVVSNGEVNTVSSKVSGALPNADKAIIDPNKLTSYALNPQHPEGGNKAKVFEAALGYNQSNADLLIGKIQQGVTNNPAVMGVKDQFGQRFTVDMPITGPNGNTVMVRTGWILDTGATVPRLATTYVK